jgi:hypothetical protein
LINKIIKGVGVLRILTKPEKIKKQEKKFLTGNKYLSLPNISPISTDILEMNFLHFGQKSIIRVLGENRPLIKFHIFLEGIEISGKWKFDYENYWIPAFSFSLDDINLKYTILTPIGFKGFVCNFDIENISNKKKKLQLKLEFNLDNVYYHIFEPHKIDGHTLSYVSRWKNCFITEFKTNSFPLFAIGISVDNHIKKIEGFKIKNEEIKLKNRDCRGKNKNFEIKNKNYKKETNNFNTKKGYFSRLALKAEKEIKAKFKDKITFYFGIGREGEGAALTQIDLKRRGYEELYKNTKDLLQIWSLDDENIKVKEKLNRNLFFNYFYSLGKYIDNDKFTFLPSKSPEYYVSGAFWARDTFLWSFPAILLLDKKAARQAFIDCWEQYSSNFGDHALYLGGTILYPGFELDELVSPILALEKYIKTTGDISIINEISLKNGLEKIYLKILEKEEKGLYSTFLEPSDDPVIYKFLTYDNVLVWKAFKIGRWFKQIKILDSKIDFERKAKELKNKILKNCVVEGPFGKMFAWSIDLEGNFLISDNPPGSLLLLPYYGFCDYEDKLYLNTVKWINSDLNSYHFKGKFEGNGNEHAENPQVFHICNRLLTDPDFSIDYIADIPLDDSLACESYDKDTGLVSTGAAFASAGGFLAYSIYLRRSKI